MKEIRNATPKRCSEGRREQLSDEYSVIKRADRTVSIYKTFSFWFS